MELGDGSKSGWAGVWMPGEKGVLESDSKPLFLAPDWSTVTEFERRIAEFFGAPYAVAVDSCTHGVELCLRYKDNQIMYSPKRTYLSIPMLAHKMNISLFWVEDNWTKYYAVGVGVFDAATFWEEYGYRAELGFMCISFQYQKHLSLGRGGIILCPDELTAIHLKRLAYDGRSPGIPWREQNIKDYGYHYYMTPETAALGLQKLDAAISTPPRIWTSADYPDLTQMDVFKHKVEIEANPEDVKDAIMKELANIKNTLEENVDRKIAALKAELTQVPVTFNDVSRETIIKEGWRL